MITFAAAALAGMHVAHRALQFRPAARQPAPIVSRDPNYRALDVRNVRPGAEVEIYYRGRLLASAYARGPAVRLPLRFVPPPGTPLTVVQHAGSALAAVPSTVSVTSDYVTDHYNQYRWGWSANETILNTTNVNPSTFGELFTLPADGTVYAQPLYAQAETMGDGSVHDVLIVATENDTVYAYDADDGTPLWERQYVGPGVTALPTKNISCGNVKPWVGITGTPVIDRGLDTVFFVTTIKQTYNGTFHHLLHAISLSTGAEQPYSP